MTNYFLEILKTIRYAHKLSLTHHTIMHCTRGFWKKIWGKNLEKLRKFFRPYLFVWTDHENTTKTQWKLIESPLPKRRGLNMVCLFAVKVFCQSNLSKWVPQQILNLFFVKSYDETFPFLSRLISSLGPALFCFTNGFQMYSKCTVSNMNYFKASKVYAILSFKFDKTNFY